MLVFYKIDYADLFLPAYLTLCCMAKIISVIPKLCAMLVNNRADIYFPMEFREVDTLYYATIHEYSFKNLCTETTPHPSANMITPKYYGLLSFPARLQNKK